MFKMAIPVLHVSSSARRHVVIDMPPTDQTWGNRRNKIAFVRPAR